MDQSYFISSVVILLCSISRLIQSILFNALRSKSLRNICIKLKTMLRSLHKATDNIRTQIDDRCSPHVASLRRPANTRHEFDFQSRWADNADTRLLNQKCSHSIYANLAAVTQPSKGNPINGCITEHLLHYIEPNTHIRCSCNSVIYSLL